MSHNTRPLNRQDYKTLTLAALGGALEFYDFIIIVFFAAVVGALFFPADIPEWLRQVQTFGIFAAGYLAVGAAVRAAQGQGPFQIEPLEFVMVRQENMYNPENQKLLFPVTR